MPGRTTAPRVLESASNPAFRRWLRLAESPRAVREQGRALAEGLHLAQAAQAAGVGAAAVLLRRGAPAGAWDAAVAGWPGVPRYELAGPLYDRLSPVEHGTGLMFELVVPQPQLPPHLDEDLLLLDGVQDPGNAGALLRTAAAAGLRVVVAVPGTAALWAPKVLRAGMGAHFHLHLHEGVVAAELAAVFRGDLVAAVAHGAPSLWAEALPGGPLAWVFGAEGAGPSAATLAVCARQVTIPTDPAVESLNVGAAAAVCLFERRRQVVAGAELRRRGIDST